MRLHLVDYINYYRGGSGFCQLIFIKVYHPHRKTPEEIQDSSGALNTVLQPPANRPVAVFIIEFFFWLLSFLMPWGA